MTQNPLVRIRKKATFGILDARLVVAGVGQSEVDKASISVRFVVVVDVGIPHPDSALTVATQMPYVVHCAGAIAW